MPASDYFLQVPYGWISVKNALVNTVSKMLCSLFDLMSWLSSRGCLSEDTSLLIPSICFCSTVQSCCSCWENTMCLTRTSSGKGWPFPFLMLLQGFFHLYEKTNEGASPWHTFLLAMIFFFIGCNHILLYCICLFFFPCLQYWWFLWANCSICCRLGRASQK